MALDLPATPKRDSWGRYLIVPRTGGKAKAYTRATTIAETLDDRYNLELWKMRQVSIGMAARPDLVASVAAADPGDKKTINDLCRQALDAAGSKAAANTGTAIHAALERVNRGDAVDTLPEMFRDTATRYVDTLAAHGATVCDDSVEVIHVLDRHTIAGTADLHVMIDGRRVIADIKTGSGIDYGAGGFAVQLAIYANADSIYDPGTETHRDMPEVDLERALIIHAPAAGGDIVLHWLDIAAGAEALEHAMWARTWRKRRDLLQRRPIVDEGDIDPALATKAGAAVREALDTIGQSTLRQWLDEGDEGGRPWRMAALSSRRRFELIRAATRLVGVVELSDGTADGDLARSLLSAALGETVPPSVAVGTALGALDIDAAVGLRHTLDLIAGGAATLRVDDDGRVSVAS